jgi:signal transduction histidine kinase
VRRSRAGLPEALVPRLIVVTVLAGAVAALTGAVLLQTVATGALRERIIERDTVRAEELAGRLDSRIESAVTTMQVIANNRLIARMGPESVTELRALLRAAPAFDELLLYDRDGQAVAAAASGYAAELVEFPARPDIAGVIGSEHFVALSVDVPPLVELAVAVERPPGSVVGFVLARQGLEDLAAPVEKRETTTSAVNFLVDGTGRILVHPERDRLLNGEVFPTESLRRDGYRHVRDGRAALVGAAPMSELDAWVVVEEDEAQALRPVAAQLQQLVAILIAVLAAAVIAMSLAGHRLLRPLRALASAVQRLAKGERGVRAGTIGRGEVRRLSDEFDRMAATIDDRDAQLEQLHRLALLVSASVGDDDLTHDLTAGAATLLGAESCAFIPAAEGLDRRLPPAVQGEAPTDDVVAAALTACVDRGRHRLGQMEGRAWLAVPVTTLAGATLGVLTLMTARRAFNQQDVQLAQTFASFAGVALDNARRLRMEQAIVDELQETIEAKRMFVGGVTHELRTPLTCIEGFSTALLEGWDSYPDEDRTTLVSKILRHAKELDALVTQLLDFAAAERGRRAADLTPVAIAELIDHMRAELSPVLGPRRLETDIAGDEVLGDPTLLRRALTNLVSNAAKYSPPDSTITIRAVRVDDEVRVEVIDEGIGMSSAEADLAFQPFWRAQGSRARGTGLGLALVAEYVRAMGGNIGVVSQPGQGSTFTFTLPAVAVREVIG